MKFHTQLCFVNTLIRLVLHSLVTSEVASMWDHANNGFTSAMSSLAAINSSVSGLTASFSASTCHHNLHGKHFKPQATRNMHNTSDGHHQQARKYTSLVFRLCCLHLPLIKYGKHLGFFSCNACTCIFQSWNCRVLVKMVNTYPEQHPLRSKSPYNGLVLSHNPISPSLVWKSKHVSNLSTSIFVNTWVWRVSPQLLAEL